MVGLPNLSAMSAMAASLRYPGALELNIGDQWRARWIPEDTLPGDVPVIYAYGIVYIGDKGYVVRESGEERWGMLEGEFSSVEKPEAFIKRAARERMGVVTGKVVLQGFLICKATSHNRDYPVGSTTLRPLYIVVGKQVGDVPKGSGYERRRLPMNEFGVMMRARYPEIEQYVADAFQHYAVLRSKGEA
jgi:hypothetical protein